MAKLLCAWSSVVYFLCPTLWIVVVESYKELLYSMYVHCAIINQANAHATILGREVG